MSIGSSRAAEFMAQVSGASGAAIVDASGNLVESAGAVEGETLAAACVMSAGSLNELGALLGFGQIQAWTIASDGATIYVRSERGAFSVAVGPPSRSPETVLKKLAKAPPGGLPKR